MKKEFDCEVCPVKKAYDLKEELKEKLVVKVPRATKEHLVSAKKEFLLAIKSVVDSALEREEKKTAKTKPKKVKVE